jgi:hypothetical protein
LDAHPAAVADRREKKQDAVRSLGGHRPQALWIKPGHAMKQMPTVGALLGHTVPATTARYAHLLDDPLRRITERVGAMLSPGLPTGGKHGER